MRKSQFYVSFCVLLMFCLGSCSKQNAPSVEKEQSVAPEIAYFRAAQNGQAKTIRRLIKTHPEFIEMKNDDRTALHILANPKKFSIAYYPEGYLKSLKTLLDAGANVDVRDAKGQTPLMSAVIFVHGYGDLLRNNQIVVNGRRQFAHEFALSAISLFLSAGADVNAKAIGNYDATALHMAAKVGSFEIVEFLIARGADREAKTTKGLSPRDVTRSSKIIKLLRLRQ